MLSNFRLPGPFFNANTNKHREARLEFGQGRGFRPPERRINTAYIGVSSSTHLWFIDISFNALCDIVRELLPNNLPLVLLMVCRHNLLIVFISRKNTINRLAVPVLACYVRDISQADQIRGLRNNKSYCHRIHAH